MEPSSNQIEILLNYKTNMDGALKDLEILKNQAVQKLEVELNALSGRIGQLKRKNEIKAEIASIEDYFKKEKDLYKQQSVFKSEELKRTSALQESEQKKNLNTFKNTLQEKYALIDKVQGWNDKLAQTEESNAQRILETNKATAKVSAAIAQEETAARVKADELTNKAKLDANKKYDAETEKLSQFAAGLQKQSLAEELSNHKANRKAKLDADKAAADAYKKTAGGAWENGSTLGHKFVTTAQYAIAGTALFGVASAFTAMGAAAAEADLNMRTMSAVLGLNISQAKDLDASVRKLGETYGGTTQEIEQVAIALGRAGVKTRDIKDATEVTLAMARLTGDTFEQSSSAVISYQQVFGDTRSITELGNKLAYVANVSRLSTQDIGTFSNYALAAAKDVGLTEDAVGGLAAAFSNAGVNASTIGTQIRRFTTLLTESSTDVNNFFKGIGVNQQNLLMEMQKGGEASNKALLDFVKVLQSVDQTKFTGLVGQMDILAANSLKLMRNNGTNISRFVSELQTGVSDQLSNTKVILESYIVTYESLWNKVKNLGTAAGTTFLDAAAQTLTESWYNVIGDDKKVQLIKLAQAKQANQAWLEERRAGYEAGTIQNNEWYAAQQQFARKEDTINQQVLNLEGKVTKAKKLTQEERLKDIQDNLKKQEQFLSNPANVSDKQVQFYMDLAKEEDELTKSHKENTAAAILNANAQVKLSERKEQIEAVLKTNGNATKLETMYRNEAQASIEGNTKAIQEQINTLNKYSSIDTKGLTNINNISDTSTKYVELNNLLKDTVKTYNELTPAEQNSEKGDALAAKVNVLKTSIKYQTESMNVMAQSLELDKFKTSLEDKSNRSAETAAQKAEKVRELQGGITNAKAQQELIQEQLDEGEKTSLEIAELKHNKALATLKTAQDLRDTYKGTDEITIAQLSKDYEEAKVKAMTTELDLTKKIKDEENAHTNLMATYKNSLEESVATQEYRLGLIEKERLNEVEKLRLKLEEDKVNKKLQDGDYERISAQINQLETLSRKKKDFNTFAMEYQRELTNQESAGYIAAKAGVSALENGMVDFFTISSEGWMNFHKLATSVLDSIYKQLLQELLIKQMVSGIIGAFTPAAPTGGTVGGVTSTAFVPSAGTPDFSTGGFSGNSGYSGFQFANGGIVPTKGYASGGVLQGGTGIRDDIYLGNVQGTQVFAMGGEFITRKDSVNENTKGTLDYINQTGTVPNAGANVNVPVSINIENQTGQDIKADMIQSISKQNSNGEYEKVVNIILKASQTDPRMKSLLKR